MPRPVIHPRLAASLERVVSGTFNKFARHLRAQAGTDAMTTFAAAVPCRLERDMVGFGDEKVVAGQVQAFAYWIITLPAGHDVRTSDQFVIEGRTFEVKAPGDPQSYPAETFVRCVEIGR